MDALTFTGRKKELDRLNDLLKKNTASLVVIKGRRRIGKSRLVEEFAQGHTFYHFSGLPPVDHITSQDQRDEFAYLLSKQTGLPKIKTDDWSKLFSLLGERIKSSRVVVLFDEITWMAHNDATFLAKLKNAWDLQYKKNPQLIFILCGSISAWIEKNIVSSTGYFGRISQIITLSELSLASCNALMNALGFKRSKYEKFLLLSLMGGIPWYIELIHPSYSAADNIKKLCFEADGVLVKEHDHIFHDLFGRKSNIYEKITHYLAGGAATYGEIAEGIHYPGGGVLSEYLEDLVISGYISRHYNWSIKTGEETSVSVYRLADNYLRFYYKYIQPKLTLIQNNQFDEINLAQLPAWTSMMGFQFENLVLNNRNLILEALRINRQDIVIDNPYRQRATKRFSGCQIDYLIQTRFNTLFVCEIKFSKQEINASVIQQDKLDRLQIPKGFSCVPVLIHINGVTEAVADAGYFSSIIDFSEFFEY